MTLIEIHPILSLRNSDNRDDDIIFYEKGIKNKKFFKVYSHSTLIHTK